MRREPGIPVKSESLPDGYRFVFYADGDETDWARLEAAVLEFDSEFQALMFFKEKFVPQKDELYKRCIFIEDNNGKKVATANAWWSNVRGLRRPWLHWVATDPEYQGMGLGKAVVARVTQLLVELYPNSPLFLKTQTWSYKAVNIYMSQGYFPTDEKALYVDRKDNCKKAVKILSTLLEQYETSCEKP